MSSFAGGLRVSTSNASLYTGETAGDVVIYTGNSNQTLYIGHSNFATPGIAMTSNLNVKFGKDITSYNMNATGSMIVHMGGITPSQTNTNVEATIARNSLAASNHTFAMGTIDTVTSWNDISALSNNHNVTFGATSSTFSSNVFIKGALKTATYLTIGSNANTSYPLHVQSAGLSNISIMAEGDISGLSDIRTKTRIEPISGALAKMDLIKGYTFNWVRDANAPRSAGVIAQEIREVLPEVVSSDTTDDAYMHVAYGNVSALLIQAIKDLAHRTTALTLCTTERGHPIDAVLPERKTLIGDAAAAPWRVAVISASDDGADSTGAYVAVSEDGARLVGRCGAPGKYSVMVTC